MVHGSPSAREAPPLSSSVAACSARFIGDRGFSIGIDDVTPKERLLKAKAATLETG